MTTSECRSELVLAERRGVLSSASRLALEEHLVHCQSCRILRQIGRDFDEPSRIRANDAEQLERLLAASEQWLVAPRSLRKSPMTGRLGKVLLVAGAIVATVSAAAAATFVLRASSLRSTPEVDGAATTNVTTTTAPKNLFKAEEHPQQPQVEPAVPTVPTVASAASSEIVRAIAPVGRDATAEVELTAAQLLQQATLSRRAGNSAEASRLFRKLQQRYPSSRESALSHVAFGSLLLERGQSAFALEQFNRYLASRSGQNLAAEALYGRGRALAQLGRSAEERATWNQLLDQFPKSPYVTFARKRLDAAK
ncbi:MAG: tetratricopeptide repeat protein [Polyangiaceae bacterium]